MTIFHQIRAACARITELADHVQINDDRLEHYVDTFPIDRLEKPIMDDAHHLIGSGADTVAYIITLDAINFGSGYFDELHPREGLCDYFLIARAIRDRFESQGPFTADEFQKITAEECAHIFGQPLDEPGPQELMEKFAEAWRVLGIFLANRFDGDFAGLVQAADERADNLVKILSEMPPYRDIASYADFEVPFFKRAQITVADLYLAMAGTGLGCFHDIHELTMFADNQVPHVLRTDGILQYSDELASLITAGEFLAAGSPEEVEIRACSIHTVERLVDALYRRGHSVTSMAVDNYLWHLGESPKYRQKPMHKTRTFYY